MSTTKNVPSRIFFVLIIYTLSNAWHAQDETPISKKFDEHLIRSTSANTSRRSSIVRLISFLFPSHVFVCMTSSPNDVLCLSSISSIIFQWFDRSRNDVAYVRSSRHARVRILDFVAKQKTWNFHREKTNDDDLMSTHDRCNTAQVPFVDRQRLSITNKQSFVSILHRRNHWDILLLSCARATFEWFIDTRTIFLHMLVVIHWSFDA
jgi:hypothetical protein